MLKNKSALSLTPLALLTLAACGSSTSTKTGKAEKGPLNLAQAFLDYDGDGVYDSATEPGGVTDSTGSYSFLETLQPSAVQTAAGYSLKVVTSGNTVDMSTGTVVDGITLSAPIGSSMITPVTTIMAESSMTKAEVVAALGLPATMDPLTFSAFDTTLSDADKLTALKVEKAAQKVMAVVSTFASAAESSGASASVAYASAMTSVVEAVKDVSDAYKIAEAANAGTGVVMSFSTAQVDAVKAEMDTQVAANLTVAQKAVFDTQVTNNVLGLKNVVAAIEAIDITDAANLDLSASKDIFATVSVLVSQVETATAAVKTLQDNGSALTIQTVAFTSPAAVTASANNPGPTDIAISNATISEDASSLNVGTVTTTDTSDTGTAEVKDSSGNVTTAYVAPTTETGHTYSLVNVTGTDYASFSIDSATGVLSLLAQPDYETKSSYTVAVKTTESGANPKSYVETLTISVTDVEESGAFGINSDVVTWTDYNPATSADITNTVMTASSSGNVALGAGAAAVKLNATNLEYLSDGDASTTGKSPTLKFTLKSVPTGSGPATIKATITDGSDATRSGTEDQISLTVNVSYLSTDGISATLKAEAGSATGSYDKGDGTSVSFSVTNEDADWFSITAANEVSGLPATLDVKLEKLVSLMNASSSAGDLTPLTQLGTYNVAIETTLPLKNAALETVTTFSGNVELVASTTKDTVYGTAGADSITGGATSEIIFGGTGKDTIATGDGADFIVLAAGDGSTTLANSNTVSDFTNTTSTVVGDKFALDGLTFSDLTIEADATTPADTVISVTSTSEYLMTVTGVAYGYIDTNDFIVVADIA
jgi:hypothetical protein